MITEDVKEKNYSVFFKYLSNLIGEQETIKLIGFLGGEEVVKNASFGTTIDSGTAYDGALINVVLEIAKVACQINAILPEEKQVQRSSIYKSVLLQHIAKSIMYKKNTNEWEIKNRGILYTFKKFNNALRCGERSLHLLVNVGLNLTEDEFEAIRILDKTKDDDNYSKYYSNILAQVVKQANEIVTAIMKQ